MNTYIDTYSKKINKLATNSLYETLLAKIKILAEVEEESVAMVNMAVSTGDLDMVSESMGEALTFVGDECRYILLGECREYCLLHAVDRPHEVRNIMDTLTKTIGKASEASDKMCETAIKVVLDKLKVSLEREQVSLFQQ